MTAESVSKKLEYYRQASDRQHGSVLRYSANSALLPDARRHCNGSLEVSKLASTIITDHKTHKPTLALLEQRSDAIRKLYFSPVPV